MSKRLTTEEYVAKCKLSHGDRYDYSVTTYIDDKVKVAINCRIHGVFYQRPSDHRRGFGCPTCSGNAKGTTETFIEKARKIHGDFYDYSKTLYLSLEGEVIIICPKHGEFLLKPRYHLYGTAVGCSKCRRSKGEVAIKEWLIEHQINFEEQKIFNNLPRKRFDFYLPDQNLCIEFDGAQHFHIRHQKTRDLEKANKRFKDLQLRDAQKNEFCKLSGIGLLRIPFHQLNNISKILEGEDIHNSPCSTS